MTAARQAAVEHAGGSVLIVAAPEVRRNDGSVGSKCPLFACRWR